ncbi:MAG TPA: c-type cytochrome domain-containing protein [Urbifossiella sp.]|jgi:WD40 repeat protein/mono/diheme cytochrome c family protein|nr:c-type cytochrome domain-containing protein [Urbifossiella sp.]
MTAKPFALAAGLLAAFAVPAAADESPLAGKARAVLKTHCYRCHGQEGAVEGGLNYVADLGKLVSRKKVVPGQPDESRLLKRMVDGTMPPPDEHPRPSDADTAAVRAWIQAGAPGASPAARTPLSPADVNAAILADLDTHDRRARRFQRYFTLAHLYNAGLSDEELQTYRNALSKLVNSLSWHATVRIPVAVDPARTILRIDLRWYLWDAALWNRILQEYPYGVLDDTIAARAVSVNTAARLPVVRADWFVATASRAPLYYDILQLPANLSDLERQLRVDSTLNVQQERVVRIGFNGSGVSRFNRILERHDSAQGMYWRTYDFDEPPANLNDRANGTLVADRRNIFAHPLGPVAADAPFQHAGGEAIFALPNGLHAFFLVNAVNARLDKAPVAIVSDPKRPDRAVEAGVSCMSCHVTGILPKPDQVRDHAAKNPAAFRRADADLIRALYPPKEQSLAVMQDDMTRYAAALGKTGSKVSRFEPVSTITGRYEADLDLPLAAAEVGLRPEEFVQRVNSSETLAKHVGALRASGGTVSRQIWVQAFGDHVRELQLGSIFQGNQNGPTLPDNTGEIDPLEARGESANQAAFSADGRRAVIASGDRSVRVYDVEGRRDVKRLVGHTASVWAVGLSADAKRAVSGSLDGTARVWDLATGIETARYTGHDGLVSAVAFTPDGKWGVSGGFDGVVAVWKTATGEELRRRVAGSYVTAVAVSADGKSALVAAGRTVVLWDLVTGAELKSFPGHRATVTAVAFDPAGQGIATGDDSGKVRVWDVSSGACLAELAAHDGPVRSIAVRNGRWVLSASSDRTVRLSDARALVPPAVFRRHAAPVVSAAFLANGTQTVSADRGLTVLPWAIERFLTAAPQPVPPTPKTPDRIPYADP